MRCALMLIKTKGNLITLAEQGVFDVIVHGCNCFHTMNSGIAKEVKAKYPEAYQKDLSHGARGDTSRLGTYSQYDVPSKDFIIVNGYTQYRYGTDKDYFEYDAFANLLANLYWDFPNSKFGFPYIGMGRAGGDPSRIIPLLEEFAEKVADTSSIVTLVEFG